MKGCCADCGAYFKEKPKDLIGYGINISSWPGKAYEVSRPRIDLETRRVDWRNDERRMVCHECINTMVNSRRRNILEEIMEKTGKKWEFANAAKTEIRILE